MISFISDQTIDDTLQWLCCLKLIGIWNSIIFVLVVLTYGDCDLDKVYINPGFLYDFDEKFLPIHTHEI